MGHSCQITAAARGSLSFCTLRSLRFSCVSRTLHTRDRLLRAALYFIGDQAVKFTASASERAKSCPGPFPAVNEITHSIRGWLGGRPNQMPSCEKVLER